MSTLGLPLTDSFLFDPNTFLTRTWRVEGIRLLQPEIILTAFYTLHDCSDGYERGV